MEDEKKFDRDNWMAKIQKLLATAEGYDRPGHDGTPARPEYAAELRAKAEKLMNTYRIKEEELREAVPLSESMAPVTKKVRICDYRSPYRDNYVRMASSAVNHAGCRWASKYENGSVVGFFTGFAIDVAYAELLLLNASVVFAAHLEPSYDRNETETENIYRLRRSGKTRREIAVMLWGIEKDHSVPAHGKVQKIYEDECARRGERPLSGRGVNREVYRELYADQFYDTFARRLRQARTAAGLDQDGQLVMANRDARVLEAYYEAHPHLRPGKDVDVEWKDTRTDAQKERDRKRQEKIWAAEEAKRRSPEGRLGSAAGEEAGSRVPLRGTTSRGRLED